MITALAALCAGLLTMISTGIVFWGGAFIPLADAWAVLSMAAIIGFSFHYPQKTKSPAAWPVAVLTGSVTLLAFGLSVFYAYRIIVLRVFTWSLPDFTLEQRIANRTRELAALYDVSAAASQAQNLQILLIIFFS